MSSECEISVVIPVYRSAATLRELLDRLLTVLPSLCEKFEVVFVDDASPDDSWRIVCDLQARNPAHVTAIRLMRNFGQHNALMAGFHRVRGRMVVTMDDDLQHPPEEIGKLISTLRSAELDVVYGDYGEKQHAGWRNAGSAVVTRFFQFVFRVKVTPTAFRAMRLEVIKSILPYHRNFTIVDGLLAWSTSRMAAVRVEHRPRLVGTSGYSVRKLMLQTVNVLANFSLVPLQLVSAVGVVTSFIGFLLACYYLFQYFQSAIGVPGYGSLIVTILITSGLQLLSLGVIGEYLGRVLLNSNMKPQFVERTVLLSRNVQHEGESDVRSSGET